MRKRGFFLLSCMVLCYTIVHGQSKAKIDSLEKLLKGDIPDTARALNMMNIAVQYELIDTSAAFQKYRAAINFAKAKNLNYQLGLIYQNFSFLYTALGTYDGVKQALDSAMLYLETATHPRRNIIRGYILSTLGGYYRNTNDFPKAADSYLKAITLFEADNQYAQLINSYIDLSNIYKEMLEYPKQEVYTRKALNVARKTNSRLDYFKSYSFTALSLVMQNRYDEALKHIDSAGKNYVSTATAPVLISYHLIAGLTYLNFYKFDSAENHFQNSYKIAEKNNTGFSKMQSQLQLGRVLSLKKRFTEADSILMSVNSQLKRTGEFNQFVISLDYISRNYEEWGKYKEALKYYKEFKEISDSMSSVSNKQYAADLEIKYETAKKDNHILQQDVSIRQKNTLNYFLIGGTTALLSILGLGYRNYRNRQKINRQKIDELETEKHLMATEAVLKGEEKERTRLAKDLHDGLGGMLSGIKYSFQTMKGNLIMTPENQQAFERSMDMLDSSIKEMRRVAHNMMPEALVKFGLDIALKDFCNDINQSGVLKINYQSKGLKNEIIDQTTAITIYRIVQELVNNTIKHAAASSAIVQVDEAENAITLTVEDNGKGFDTKILENKGGIGWSNIQSRIDYLRGNLDIKSAAGKGTSVLITFDKGREVT